MYVFLKKPKLLALTDVILNWLLVSAINYQYWLFFVFGYVLRQEWILKPGNGLAFFAFF